MQSRRRLLDAAARLVVVWLAGLAGGFWPGRRAHAAADRRTFAAYLDTLVPGDASAPGAVGLGIHERLTAAARDDAMIEAFCRWLDARAQAAGGGSFADLQSGEREAIVRAAETAAPESLAYRAFQRTRHDAYVHYYADARSWPGIGYRGPPQPDGFLDYARPPGNG